MDHWVTGDAIEAQLRRAVARGALAMGTLIGAIFGVLMFPTIVLVTVAVLVF